MGLRGLQNLVKYILIDGNRIANRRNDKGDIHLLLADTIAGSDAERLKGRPVIIGKSWITHPPFWNVLQGAREVFA
jgi:hypothetical protein